jgi:hypothetical protein
MLCMLSLVMPLLISFCLFSARIYYIIGVLLPENVEIAGVSHSSVTVPSDLNKFGR